MKHEAQAAYQRYLNAERKAAENKERTLKGLMVFFFGAIGTMLAVMYFFGR